MRSEDTLVFSLKITWTILNMEEDILKEPEELDPEDLELNEDAILDPDIKKKKKELIEEDTESVEDLADDELEEEEDDFEDHDDV